MEQRREKGGRASGVRLGETGVQGPSAGALSQPSEGHEALLPALKSGAPSMGNPFPAEIERSSSPALPSVWRSHN